MAMPRKIEISHKTIVFAVFLVISLWVIFQIRDILLMLFVSLILMSAFNPAVDKLEKFHFPRWLAILFLYIIVWMILGITVAIIVPQLIVQTSNLIIRLPLSFSRLSFFNSNQELITQQFMSRIGSIPESLLHFTVSLFGNLINFLTTIVITFYLLLERKNLNKYLGSLFENHSLNRITRTINEIEGRLGGWVRGELILMLSIGIMTYIGLLILGVDSALPLALIAGILEIVPNIGPIISAIPAILIAFTIHPLTALATLCVYFLVQFLENHLLVPKVMQKAVGVNPLLSILGLMIGFRLAGPGGAILAIPFIIVIQSVGLEYFK